MESPLFSILIANFNNRDFIEEAITSIINQTYKNWEIIIVDDASTDNSIDIIEKHKSNSKIKIYSNKVNKGCGFTKNKCINLSNGEILGFLDPDDTLESNAIEIMIEHHLKYKGHSLIYSSLNFCDKNLNFLSKSNFPKQIDSKSSYLKSKSGRISHFATFKISFYNKTCGINPEFIRAVDQDLYLKLEEVGKLLFINEHLYNYRNHENSISLNENKEKAFAWNILAKIEACKRRNISIEEILPKFIFSEEGLRRYVDASSSYKLGNALLKPIRFIKSKLGFYK
ncbi:MAG: glycosyl transferase family 2 [Crocinitomicaceae bacterium]|nr:glycosyl transferase family 2 [Crocinitomicaceae bacterium]